MVKVGSALRNEIEKVALSDKSVYDIEEGIGKYLSDKQEEEARDLIAKAKEKSFIQRHPYLTGIPTLGLAPLFSNASNLEDITRKLIRKHPDLRQHVESEKEKSIKREHELNLAAEKNPFGARAAVPAMMAASMLFNRS